VRKALEKGRGAARVAEVLHHRLTRPRPPATVRRLNLRADLPRVSIVVPTRDRVDLLSTCIAGVEVTDYPDIEVIVVDNDSIDAATKDFLAGLPGRSRPGLTMRVLSHPGNFNYSTINNRAGAAATGELLCLLNNDIEVRDDGWLAIMATQALREDVGAVGAQLLYPDGRLQHAGVVIGVGNAAGHAHRFLRPEEEGYFRRHALPQFVSAVTAACLVVQRQRFLAVCGLDPHRFPVAFNDVDLCLRLNARGWQAFYEPRAVLVHHESVSRGLDLDPVGAARFRSELAALQQIWKTNEIFDPYHHPRLSRASEQFVLAI
jgi:GT2 family glycosyltransferase